MLMTCCEDGSICMWRLGDENEAMKSLSLVSASAKQRQEENEMNLESLVLRSDWANRGQLLDNAMRQLEEIKKQTELQVRAIEQDCTQKTYAIEGRRNDQFERAVDKIQVSQVYAVAFLLIESLRSLFIGVQELEKKLAEQSEQSHQQQMQLRLDSDNERRRMEEAHHSKLATEYRHHQTLEVQIEQLKQQHIR